MGAAFDTPVLLVGCGRLGSAVVEGWLDHGPVDANDLLIQSPSIKPVIERAVTAGARYNPAAGIVGQARVIVLAVKPARWRSAVAELIPHIHASAVIVSLMAGVRAEAIAQMMSRPVARLMPTTAVAQARGIAALWSDSAGAAETARQLFSPLADVVDLVREDQIDIATAVAGSGPAYIHAFTLALAEAGIEAGLGRTEAIRLARGAVRSAAAAPAGEALDALIARIASPGGTTEAGLRAGAAAGLDTAARATVLAALHKARELSAE